MKVAEADWVRELNEDMARKIGWVKRKASLHSVVQMQHSN